MYEKTNSFLLCMDLQAYSHYCFSKLSRTLFDFLNNTYWVSLFQRNNLLIFQTEDSCFFITLFYYTLFCCGGKANLVWFTLFYSTLLTLTDGQTDRQTDRQRNEYTRFAWAGGTFIPVVLLCQSFALAGNRFWVYILLCTQSIIQLWCCVNFFGSGGKQFLGYVHTQSTIQLCGCVIFLVVVGKLILYKFYLFNQNFLLFLVLAGNFVIAYVLSVQYSCAVVSVLLLLRESLFCTNTLQSQLFLKNIENFLCKKNDPILNLLTRRPTLSCFVWIYNHTVTIVSQKYQELCLIS